MRGCRGWQTAHGPGDPSLAHAVDEHCDVDAITASHPVLAADDMRQIDRACGQRTEGVAQPGAFTRTECIVTNRLVARQWHVGDGIHAARMPAPQHGNRWLIRQHRSALIVKTDKGARHGRATARTGSRPAAAR